MGIFFCTFVKIPLCSAVTSSDKGRRSFGPIFMSEDRGEIVLQDFEKGLEIGGKKGRLVSARMIKNA